MSIEKNYLHYNTVLELLEQGFYCMCGKKLGKKFMDMYPHDGGIDVPDKFDKQWVYVTCQRCGWQCSHEKILRRRPIHVQKR